MRTNTAFGKARVAILVLATALLASATALHAQQATVEISVKGHHFQPAEIHAPANRPLAIKSEEPRCGGQWNSKSVSLRVEKVVAAGS